MAQDESNDIPFRNVTTLPRSTSNVVDPGRKERRAAPPASRRHAARGKTTQVASPNDDRATTPLPEVLDVFFDTVVSAFDALSTLSTALGGTIPKRHGKNAGGSQLALVNGAAVVSLGQTADAARSSTTLGKPHANTNRRGLAVIGAVCAALGRKNFAIELTQRTIEAMKVESLTSDDVSPANVQMLLPATFGKPSKRTFTPIELVISRRTLFLSLLASEKKRLANMLQQHVDLSSDGNIIEWTEEHYKCVVNSFFEADLVVTSPHSDMPAVVDSPMPFSIDAFLGDVRRSIPADDDSRFASYIQEPRIVKSTIDEDTLEILQHQSVRLAMQVLNIKTLFQHQSEALLKVAEGLSVVVTTPTSSGKSLIYQLPIVGALCENENPASAIIIYPTKSLANDQFSRFTAIASAVDNSSFSRYHQKLRPYLFDGDADKESRSKACRDGNILLTNIEMVHMAILHNHKAWSNLLRTVKYIVWDEAHYYSGELGIHCAMVNRRLRRLVLSYGNSGAQFICCSATISRPVQFVKAITGLSETEVAVVNGETSTSRKLSVVLGRPNNLDVLGELGKGSDSDKNRVSPLNTVFHTLLDISYIDRTLLVLEYFLRQKIRVICFTRVRKLCEIITMRLKEKVSMFDEGLANRIVSYRGGYTSEKRKHTEESIFNGTALVIISTNALEIGVDIGELDVAVHAGYPPSLFSYRQQSGRAGRRGKESASIIIADTGTWTDRYKCSTLEELACTKELPPLRIPLDDCALYRMHIQCAAYEAPVRIVEHSALGCEDSGLFESICHDSLRYDVLFDVFHHNPSLAEKLCFPLRGLQELMWELITTAGMLLEVMEESRTIFTLYIGSIFLYSGHTYEVVQVNVELRIAVLRLVNNLAYFTCSRDYTDVDPGHTQMQRKLATERAIFVHFGDVKVTSTVFGYSKIDKRTRKLIMSVAGSDRRSYCKDATGLWIDIPYDVTVAYTKRHAFLEHAIHACAHLLLNVTTKDDLDTPLRTECKHPAAERYRSPTIVLYELGIFHQKTPLIYHSFEAVLREASNKLDCCSCEKGCHECVWWTNCPEGNLAISKDGAKFILHSLLDLHVGS